MTRHDQMDPRATAGSAPLTAGPRWYRRRIRTLGPLFGLVPMAILGVVAIAALRIGDGRTSGLIGLVAGSAAAPGLLVAGAPFADESTFPLAIVGSIPLWIVLGSVAAWRSTRRPVAGWSDYGRELFWLSLAVVLGAVVAVGVAAAIVGQSLFL